MITDGIIRVFPRRCVDMSQLTCYNTSTLAGNGAGAFVLRSLHDSELNMVESKAPAWSVVPALSAKVVQARLRGGFAMDENYRKKCAKCGEVKPAGEFHKKAQQGDGLQTRCKNCIHQDSADYYARTATQQKEKSHEWYEQNKDYWKAKVRVYEKAHLVENREKHRLAAIKRRRRDPERFRLYSRQLYWRDPETMRTRARLWRESHSEQVRLAGHSPAARASGERWRRANRDKIRERNKQWLHANPDKRRDYCARRRAASHTSTVERFTRQEIFERDNGRCHICGKRVNPQNWHLDHLIPLSRGGEHSRINVAVSHPLCNERRSNTGPAQLRCL